MAKQSKNKVKLEQQYRKIGIIPKTAITKINKNGIGLGKIKKGLTQLTIEQDVRALANGHFKNTTIF